MKPMSERDYHCFNVARFLNDLAGDLLLRGQTAKAAKMLDMAAYFAVTPEAKFALETRADALRGTTGTVH